MISRLMSILKSKLLRSVSGVIALCLMIWFLGPWFSFAGYSPLQSTLVRTATIAVILFVYAASKALAYFKKAREEKGLVDGLLNKGNESDQSGQVSEELETLKANMEEAITALKSGSESGAPINLQDLPWYIIIGPPGAGKTTLLENSDLKFPLSEKFGKKALGGIGGTRNCDWWFTNEAILLDTAGRYTTQDSNAEVDSEAWSGFLDLIKEKRKLRPINGVIIALSVGDLLESDQAELEKLADSIRTRLQELQSTLGVVPPVYTVFTKCDLLNGFNEFFGDLDSKGREQIWGFTFPIKTGFTADDLSHQLELLSKRLNEQVVSKLQNESSTNRREKIYLFPQQFAHFIANIKNFANGLFSASSFEQDPMFRGIYFSSATQIGSPIDRVMGAISSRFKLPAQQLAGFSSSGKSYFINDFFSRLVFRESGLAGLDFKAQKSRKILNITTNATLITAGGLGALLMTWAYFINKDYIRQSTSRVDEAVTQASVLLGGDSDIISSARILEEIELSTLHPDEFSGSELLISKSLLNPGKKLRGTANAKYEQGLRESLLPRLINRMERQMESVSNQPEMLYELLKVYLMLESEVHYDSAALTGWFEYDISTNFPDSVSDLQKQALIKHVKKLFEQQPAPLPFNLNERLISQSRAIIKRTPLEQRIYGRIKRAYQPPDNGFSIARAAGRNAPLVFARNSGKDINDPSNPLFTYSGYRDYFLSAINNVSDNLSSEQWVLKVNNSGVSGDRQRDQVRRAVHTLYLKEFVSHWEALLADIRLVPITGIPQTLELLEIVTEPESPLKQLLGGIASEVNLTKMPEIPGDEAADEDGGTGGKGSSLANIFGTTKKLVEQKPTQADPATYVVNHFKPVLELAAGSESDPGQPSPLDSLFQQLDKLYVLLGPLSITGPSGMTEQQQTQLSLELQKLRSKSKRQPVLVKNVVSGISEGVSDTVGSGLCANLNSIWKSEVLPFYNQAIHSRYPINRNGLYDIALSDFTHFFGPGGLIDNFFKQHLSQYVKYNGSALTWAERPNQPVCVSEQVLKQLEYANYIRNSFFSAGSANFNLGLRITPSRVSATIKSFTLTSGADRFEYFHGPSNQSFSINWPGASAANHISLRVTPPSASGSSGLAFDGPWAILKFLENGSLRPKGRSKTQFSASYTFGGRQVGLTVDAQSSYNPFRNKILQAFRCPQNLN